MHVSVIGCGSIGQRHVKHILAIGHDVIVTDTDDARIDSACRMGARRGALEDADAVLICTPVHTHASVARDLLDAGYRGPLFVEKPLALTVEEAEVFGRWPHAVTQVGYNLRFHPAVQKMRALIPEPTAGQFYLDCDARTWPGQAYGSMLLECSHELDLALSFGAVPVDITASVDAHDVSIWFGRSWFIAIRDREATYHRQWTLAKRGVDASLFYYAPEDLGEVMYAMEIEHFLACAAADAPTDVPFVAGLAVLQVIDQVEQLARRTT